MATKAETKQRFDERLAALRAKKAGVVPEKPDSLVKTYRSAGELVEDLTPMFRQGYKIVSQSESHKKWSLLTGFLTNKKTITVVWGRSDAVKSGVV